MKIGIVGLGFVGLSLTSVLASKGYDIIGIDIDKEKCEKIRNGISPFFEPELEKLLRSGLKKKLKIANDFLLIKNCDFIFVTVGTPQKINGEIELSMIKKAVKSVDEITYSPKMQKESGQKILIITERCVFTIENNRVILKEIVQGIDLKNDILDQMEFTPLISENLSS